jgi:DeoR/GlpR family transcriptional regulator of sugar metabolism
VGVLTAQRKNLILQLLRDQGQVSSRALASDLAVSEDTIRRDLRELAVDGKLQRVHGGALPASPALGDLTARQQVSTAGKAAIGRYAAGLVQDGQTVIIDGGTTAVQLVRALPAGLRATVITHSPVIAFELASMDTVEVLVLGGRLYRHSMVTCGAVTSEAIARIGADIFFMGVTGIHPSAELTTGDAEEAAIKRALSGRAAETWVLGSAEKVGAASAYHVVGLREVAGIITDPDAPAATVAALRANGTRVITATTASSQPAAARGVGEFDG